METSGESRANYSALIVNSNDFSNVSSQLPITLTGTGSAAKTALMDMKRHFAAIFIDPIMPHPGGMELISLAHRCRPATPIFVLYRRNKPFSETEALRLGIHAQIQTPVSAEIIRDRISPKIFEQSFNLTEHPQATAPSPDDRNFQAVSATDFLTGAISLFDVHVRLPSGRYFKILNARDTLAPERALTYIQKGVSHFYLKKASLQRCFNYCDIMAQFLITHGGISFEMKVSDLYNKGSRLMNSIQADGLTPDHADYAISFVAQIRVFIQRINLEDESQIRTLLDNVTLYDRSVSTAMIAGLLALPLKVESDSAFRAIGVAALLHDVGLIGLPEEQYREHPARGAEILERNIEIDPVSVQAVAQHHERRNNTGFPGRVKSSEINRIAELIGISDEFVDLLEKKKNDPAVNPFKIMEERIFAGFSFDVIESFRTIFMPEKSGKKRV